MKSNTASRASVGVRKSVSRWVSIAQPMMRRLHASRITARKRKPARVGTYVMSATQSRSGARGRELALEEIRRRPRARGAYGRDERLPPTHAADPGAAHQTSHPLAADVDIVAEKLGMDSWGSVR